jgi:hypothetical protein
MTHGARIGWTTDLRRVIQGCKIWGLVRRKEVLMPAKGIQGGKVGSDLGRLDGG